MIKVVCGIIFNDSKVFLCRRKTSKSMGGYWEFPGGKIEQEESPEACLKRELKEELDMEVSKLDYFETSVHDYESFAIELMAFNCVLVSWNGVLKDHDMYVWVDAEDLMNYKLAPADIPLARALLKR